MWKIVWTNQQKNIFFCWFVQQFFTIVFWYFSIYRIALSGSFKCKTASVYSTELSPYCKAFNKKGTALSFPPKLVNSPLFILSYPFVLKNVPHNLFTYGSFGANFSACCRYLMAGKSTIVFFSTSKIVDPCKSKL